MFHFLFVGFLLTNTACLEPCKNGYGRAADKLCYPLADDPEAECGEGMARTDEGECVSVTDSADATTTGGGTGGSSGGTDDGATMGGGTTGSDDASGSTSGGTGSSDGTADGGSTDGGAGGGTTTGGADGESTTVKGVLNTSDSAGFEEGDQVLIQAWSLGDVEEETGFPISGSAARASQIAGAAVTAVSIHFEFVVTEVASTGEDVRFTAHLIDVPTEWEGTPVGVYPTDLSEWITLVPSILVDGVNIVIDTGDGDGTGTGPPPDGGGPPDTGLPPLDGGGPPGG